MTTELSMFGNRNNNMTNSEFSSQLRLKSTEELFKPERRCGKIGKCLLFVLIVLLVIAVGFVIGYFVREMVCKEKNNVKTKPEEYLENFKDMIDPKEMEKNLRLFTIRPHISTTQGTKAITDYIRDTWKKYGFEVEEPEYEILLSFPQENKPNKISIINNDTKEVNHTITVQLNMTADLQSNKTFTYTPYLAFAPNGTVEGELVYANRGSRADFAELAKRNISIKGKIVIMGSIFASTSNAQALGAIGMILYPDPKIYAPKGHGFKNTFPNTPWMPPDAVHTLSLSRTYGDSLTPLLPSSEGMYRLDLNKANLPSIPAQTISYQDAQYLMSRMRGEKVTNTMKGDLKIDYRFGPGFKPTAENTTFTVRLEVNNEYVKKKIRNVIATIAGSEEPDRHVLIGNHKDAWTFGASDPSSGTATLMEISRVLWKLQQQGWRPRRTIKLCSWGGEEFALMGSYEWVEDNDIIFGERAVAYLNTDVAVGGNYVLYAQTGPMLGDLILKNLKKIQDPGNSSKTLYDTMLERLPKSILYPEEPRLSNFQFITDNIPFCLYSGLATADFSYFYGFDKDIVLYPLYHTQYDTFDWIQKFADPKFLHFKSMAQFLGSMLFDLSDSEILPFSIHRFVRSVQVAFEKINKQPVKRNLDPSQMIQLKQAIEEFVNMTKTFESAKQHIAGQQSNPLILRMLNDQISGIEKTFVSPHKIGSPAGFRKIVFADIFPSIYSAMQLKLSQIEIAKRLEFEMSLIIRCFRVATRLLKPLQ